MAKPAKRTVRLIKAPWLSLHSRLRRRPGSLRLGRRRRPVVFLLLGGLLVLIGLFFYLTNRTNLRTSAERYLKRMVNGQVQVGRAKFSFTQGIKLADIRIITLAGEAPAKLVFTADSINLRISWLALLRARLAATEITAFRPKVFLVEDGSGRWNYESLFADRKLKVMRQLPRIILRQGQIHYAEEVAGQEIPVGTFDFAARFEPTATADGGYQGQVETTHAGRAVALVKGHFDTISGSFSEITAQISLSQTLRQSLPRQARAWMDKYNISGRLSVSGQYTPKADTRIIAKLEGVDFRLPLSKQSSIAITDAHGQLQFTDKGITLGTSESGQTQPLRFKALQADWQTAGQILGYQPEADFDLDVSCRQLSLPRDPQLISALPKVHRGILNDWRPSGQIALQANIQKTAGAAPPIQTKGFIRCLDVDGTFRHFPYHLQNASGLIRFGAGKTQLENLTAKHQISSDPGRFVSLAAEGEILAPYDKAEANIIITAENLVLDDELRQALHPKKQADWDLFNPSGIANGTFRLRFRADQEPHWQTRIEAQLNGVGITFKGFPYQLSQLRGRIYIGPDHIELGLPSGEPATQPAQNSQELAFVTGLAGKAPVQLRCSLNNLRRSDQSMKLEFSVNGLELDEQLAKALPPRARALFDAFSPSGSADLSGTVSSSKNEGKDLDFLVNVQPVNVTCRHKEFPYPLEKVNGRIRLSPNRFELLDFTAKQAQASFAGSGFVASEDDKHYQADLTIVGKDVPLDKAVYNNLKPQQQQIWNELQPKGKCDVNLKIINDSEGSLTYRAKIVPRGAQVTYKHFPYLLRDLTGELTVQPDLVNVDVRSAGPLTIIKGQIEQQGEKQSAKLSVAAQDVALDEKLRAVLPKNMKAIWEAVEPSGKIDLKIDSLSYTRQASATAQLAAEGTISLKNLALSKPVSCRDLSGNISGSLRSSTDGSQLSWQGPLTLPTLSFGPLRLTNLSGSFKTSSADAAQWTLSDIQANLAGGRLLGSIKAAQGASGDFSAELQAEGIELAQLIADFESANPSRSPAGSSTDKKIQGRLKAKVQLEGKFNQPNSTAGRGRIYIDRAQLYQLPLMIRILQTLSLQSVDPNAFNTATVDFYLRGQNIVFTEIVLDGPALRMIGTGLYDKPNDSLHVVMVREPSEGLLSNLLPLPEAVVAEITGSLAQPNVQAKPFRSISEELKKLFHKREPRE